MTIQHKSETADMMPLLTIDDLEQLLRVDRRTIARLCKRGELPAPLKLGGNNRWRPHEVRLAIDKLSPRVGRALEDKTTN